MKLRLVLASLLVVASVGGCKKKKSDAATEGSGSGATASGSGPDTTTPPPGSGSAGSGSTMASGSGMGSGTAAGSGSAAAAVAVDPAMLTKLAAVKADQLIDPAGKSEVPVKGSIQDYVTALAHANGVGTATVKAVDCPGGGACVEIVGEPCPDPSPEDCEGFGVTLIVDPATPKLAGAIIAGEAVDPKLLGDKKAIRKAIQDAYNAAP